MKVVFFSTYPPAPCGIGDYTLELRHAVERGAPDVTIEVVAEQHDSVERELDSQVERVWKRGTAWDATAAAAVIARRPDVVHIQHEEAIMHQDARVIRFLEAVGKAGIARLVTLHSVYGGRLGVPIFWWPPPIFHRAIAANVETIVVHQQIGGRDFLERQGVPPEKIQVIAHGTPTSTADRAPPRGHAWACRPTRRSRSSLVSSSPGRICTRWLRPPAPSRRPCRASACWSRAGCAIATCSMRFTRRRLARAMKPGIASGWLDFRGGYIPADDVPAYLAAADLVVFPYDQAYGSASGVFHLALGAGRACICSSSPKFGEAREIFGKNAAATTAPARDVGAWERAMIALLSDERLRAQAEALATAGAAASAWPVLGQRYAQLYRDLAERPVSDRAARSTAGV